MIYYSSFSTFFCRLLNIFSLSGTVSTLTEVKFLSDLMTSSEICFAWFSLFLFINAASFLSPPGILLLIHYKSFPSPFVFLLHFHTFLLVLLFLLSSSNTEAAKYFQSIYVGLACICIVVLLDILLKLILLSCFHICSETIFGNTHTVLLQLTDWLICSSQLANYQSRSSQFKNCWTCISETRNLLISKLHVCEMQSIAF